MDNIIITNNSLVYDRYEKAYEIIYAGDMAFMDVLEMVRDKVHQGYRLLTHPLSGSIKPNETPYKSIILAKGKQEVDMDSLSLIENSILTTRKFLKIKETPDWAETILEDFRILDLSLIESVIKKLI